MVTDGEGYWMYHTSLASDYSSFSFSTPLHTQLHSHSVMLLIHLDFTHLWELSLNKYIDLAKSFYCFRMILWCRSTHHVQMKDCRTEFKQCVMWKVSLETMLLLLCTSPQLCGAFGPLSVHVFFLWVVYSPSDKETDIFPRNWWRLLHLFSFSLVY